jgi:hypothetical protein
MRLMRNIYYIVNENKDSKKIYKIYNPHPKGIKAMISLLEQLL